MIKKLDNRESHIVREVYDFASIDTDMFIEATTLSLS